MNINLIKTSASLAAVAGILAATGVARAADAGDCSAVDAAKPHIYITGSSAVKPFILALSFALKADKTIVYVKDTSCNGVSVLFNDSDVLTGAGKGAIGTAADGSTSDTCTAPVGTKASIGVSDVFATSCPNVTEIPAGIADFQGPVQAMNFIVPKGAADSIQSISAEAAYLVFGFTAGATDPATTMPYANGTPWIDKDNIWVRDSTSGTQTMLGMAINVPASSWPETAYTDTKPQSHGLNLSSDNVVSFVGGSAAPNTTIGILATTDLDNHRDTLRGLAFQAYGQSCGYWPSSSSGSKDNANVRTGKYDVWGPIHMFTKVKADKKTPVDADVADLLNAVQGNVDVDGVDVLALEAKANVIPQCAMEVARNDELGAPMSINPTCGCSYDLARGGECAGAVACTPGSCAANKVCRLGVCEAK